MAERKARPTWVRGYHPADTEKNLDALADMIEVLLPDYPVITKDLEDTIEGTTGQAVTFDLTVSDVARGTVTYQWQLKTTGAYADVVGATSVDYTIAEWAEANEGTYRCKITNTLNGATAITYSNECVATTAE